MLHLLENELNGPSKKVKAIPTIESTKDLINKYNILNEAKYFSSGIFQNYLVFIPYNNNNNNNNNEVYIKHDFNFPL